MPRRKKGGDLASSAAKRRKQKEQRRNETEEEREARLQNQRTRMRTLRSTKSEERKENWPVNSCYGTKIEIGVVPEASLEGTACDECGVTITGFRYVCVQCQSHKLCSPCEARGAHPLHYVLRVPGDRPQEEIETMLACVRKQVTITIEPAGTAEIVPDLECAKVEMAVKLEPLEEHEVDPLEETTESLHTEIDLEDIKPEFEEAAADEDVAMPSMTDTRTGQGLTCDDQEVDDTGGNIDSEQVKITPQVDTPCHVVRIPPVETTRKKKMLYIGPGADPDGTITQDNSPQVSDDPATSTQVFYHVKLDNITNNSKRKKEDLSN